MVLGEEEQNGGHTCADVLDALSHDAAVQRLKTELGAPRRERFDYAADVVANKYKACHLAVRFHGSP